MIYLLMLRVAFGQILHDNGGRIAYLGLRFLIHFREMRMSGYMLLAVLYFITTSDQSACLSVRLKHNLCLLMGLFSLFTT